MVGGRTAPRLAMIVATALTWVIVLVGTAQTDGSEELARLHDEVSRLNEQGKYDKAVPIDERAIALARKHYGEDCGVRPRSP
jgi:hypothetical protein